MLQFASQAAPLWTFWVEIVMHFVQAYFYEMNNLSIAYVLYVANNRKVVSALLGIFC